MLYFSRLIIVLLAFLKFNNISSAQQIDIQGIWEVDSIVITKIHDTDTVTLISSPEKRVKSYLDQPVTFNFNKPTLKINYDHDLILGGNYRKSNDSLIIDLDTGPLIYLIKLNQPNKIILQQTVNLMNQTKPVTEKYIMYLKK